MIFSSIHPCPFPQIKFYIFPRHFGMLDTYRPNHKRRCYWLVMDVNVNLADYSDILDLQVEILL
jgi:hypothetical protein